MLLLGLKRPGAASVGAGRGCGASQPVGDRIDPAAVKGRYIVIASKYRGRVSFWRVAVVVAPEGQRPGEEGGRDQDGPE